LCGALAGLLAASVLGWISTKRSGTSFAMITFGVGELVFVAATVFSKPFGGETGIAADRVYGVSFFGASFGPALQAYYLTAAWVFVVTGLLYALSLTPLGRVINAVRDNAARVQMLGYDPQKIRYFAMLVSGCFAGVGGALFAINFESVTVETLSAHQSGAVLLYTFIGGTTVFWGPIVGAVVGTIHTVALAAWTPAWPLYLGRFFVLVVKFAPGGIAGVAVLLWQAGRSGQLRHAALPLFITVVSALVLIVGTVGVVELTYIQTLGGSTSKRIALAGILDPRNATMGAAVGALLVAASAVFWAARRQLLARWAEAANLGRRRPKGRAA
jgi:branched-chain amino acid transport system permease protein